MRYAFESYTFDAVRLSLHCHGMLLPVKPRTAQVLAYFVRHPERLVTKNELMDELWPSEDVTEANLAQHVFLLRRIFSAHSPNESFIVTAAGHGYRFVAPVRAVNDEAPVRSPAWKAYVRGRFFADQRTGESLQTALAAFEEALKLDPGFAAAHSGLAGTQILRGQYLFADPSVFEQARGAAKIALALDAQDLEGHLALAEIALFHDWDRESALHGYDRALFLAPASTRVRVVRAWLFAIMQEHDRSVHEIETGLRAEPFSLELLTTLGAIAWLRGAYEAAREHCDYVLDLNPDYQLARYYRRAALAYGDAPGEALRAFDAETPGVGYVQQSLSIAGFAAARAGDVARAESVLRALGEGDGFPYVSPVNIARVLAGLGRSPAALAALAQAIEQRDPWTIFVPGDAAFRALRGDRNTRGQDTPLDSTLRPSTVTIVARIVAIDLRPSSVSSNSTTSPSQTNVAIPRLTTRAAATYCGARAGATHERENSIVIVAAGPSTSVKAATPHAASAIAATIFSESIPSGSRSRSRRSCARPHDPFPKIPILLPDRRHGVIASETPINAVLKILRKARSKRHFAVPLRV